MAITRSKPPAWYWVVAALSALWGAVGIFAFYSDVTMSAEAIATLSDYDQKLLASRPAWFLWVYGGAVWSGFAGGVLLLLRSMIARPVFLLSLALIIFQFGFIFAVTDLIAVKGFAVAAGFPIFIFVLALAQWWFAGRAVKRGWIG